jgi:hypothetical protein
MMDAGLAGIWSVLPSCLPQSLRVTNIAGSAGRGRRLRPLRPGVMCPSQVHEGPLVNKLVRYIRCDLWPGSSAYMYCLEVGVEIDNHA